MVVDKTVDYNIEIVSIEITKALLDHGMTQGQLADRIGISATSLSSKMNGKTRFTVNEAYKICLILGLSPLVFFPQFVPISEQSAS